MTDVILDRIRMSGAVRFGQTQLSDGGVSDHYFDLKRLLLDPVGLAAAAGVIAEQLRVGFPTVRAVGGPELGAVPLAAAVILRMHDLYTLTGTGATPAGFVVRRAAKNHGTRRLIEGPACRDADDGGREAGVIPQRFIDPVPGRPFPVALVEDVVTSGASVLRAVDAVEAAGGRCRVVFSVIDRGQGAAGLIEARGAVYRPLFDSARVLDELRKPVSAVVRARTPDGGPGGHNG